MRRNAFFVLSTLCATCGLFAAESDFGMAIMPATSSIFGPENGTAAGSADLVVQLNTKVANVQGWSFGVKVTPNTGFSMHISALKVANSALTVLAGAPPSFNNTSFFAAGNLQNAVNKVDATTGIAAIAIPDCVAVTQGIVIDFGSVVSLPISENFGLIEITVNASGNIGIAEIEAGRVIFSDEIGSPATSTVVVFGGGGLVPAVQAPAVIYAVPHTCVVAAPFTVNIDDASGVAQVASTVRLNFNADGAAAGPVQGWSYGICVLDKANLEITAATTTGTDSATVKNGASADFDKVTLFEAEGGVTHAVVIDYTAIATIQPTTSFSDLALTCNFLTTTVGETAIVAPCSTVLGFPATPNVMVVNGLSIDASMYENPRQEVCDGVVANHLGVFTVVEDKKTFIPGNANGDRRIDIADGVFLLSYIFRSGRVPPCMAAADFNNDRVIDLTDAIAVIYYQLQPEIPQMPAHGWPGATLGACGKYKVDLSCELEQPCN